MSWRPARKITIAYPVERAQAEAAQDRGQEARVGVEDPHPQQGDGDPRDDVGAEDGAPDEGIDGALPVEGDREAEAEADREHDDDRAVAKRARRGPPQLAAGDDLGVVAEPDPARRREEIPREEAVFQGEDEGVEHEQREHERRRGEHQIGMMGTARLHRGLSWGEAARFYHAPSAKALGAGIRASFDLASPQPVRPGGATSSDGIAGPMRET
jgi:hypothetical protein